MKIQQKIPILVIFLSIYLIFFSNNCNKRTALPVENHLPDSIRVDIPKFGTDSSLDIISWNIEQFPKLKEEKEKTISTVTEIIIDLDADLYGVQEITDVESFIKLINNLEDYDGTHSNDVSSGLMTAIIYKKDIIHISNKRMLFEDDSYAFPRPPLEVYVVAHYGDHVFDFTFIVLHLKALGGAENEYRRKLACQKLKDYLDLNRAGSGDPDYIVLGDWNDELDDPISNNVFQVFLDDTVNYQFLTKNLPVNDCTYIGDSWCSIIDHILISIEVKPKFLGGKIEIQKIDNYLNTYVNDVSDHRPVGSLFPIF
jgi:hypothetical protein